MDEWWRRAVFYQLYPQSFQDSNGDGIGDLKGITSRIPYLQELGVDAIWLNPIYDSPMVDNGYDIADYEKIAPRYGTLADFKTMLAALHQAGIKLVMDLVVNHTSDQHQWFQASCQDRTNPFADYYIWRDPAADGGAPNNWGSTFGGSAWTYVSTRKQYYLHLFAEKQPDLNWENPQLRQAIYAMMRDWFELGIDGFRMDVINVISKPHDLPDGQLLPNSPYGDFYPLVANEPRVHEYLKEMNREVLSHYPVVTIGETPHVTPNQANEYTDPKRAELNMVFQFDHTYLDEGPYGKYATTRFKLSDLKRVFGQWQKGLHGRGWQALYLDNHDQPRAVSRYGDGSPAAAKMLATWLLFQEGTPFFLQGDELGIPNAAFQSIEQYSDIDTLNAYRELKDCGLPEKVIMKMIRAHSRDNGRTPMPWTEDAHAGFSTGQPWMAFTPGYEQFNVQVEEGDAQSVLQFYRRLMSVRRSYIDILEGSCSLIDSYDSDIYTYARTFGSKTLLIVCSFSSEVVRWDVAELQKMDEEKQLLIDNYDRMIPNTDAMAWLQPFEARVYLIG